MEKNKYKHYGNKFSDPGKKHIFVFTKTIKNTGKVKLSINGLAN